MPDGKDGVTNQLAYRKIHSDATGQRWKAREMVYAKRRWTMPSAENRMAYSTYNSAGWSCDGIDSGIITVGVYSDENYVRWVDNGTTLTADQNGIQTWEGSGTAYSTSAIDASSSTSVVFSCEFLPYQNSSTHTFTVEIGTCDISGGNKEAWKTWSLTAANRIWFYVPKDSIVYDTSILGFYMTVTPAESDGKWAFMNAQVEFDVLEPGRFVNTAGSAIVTLTSNPGGEYRGVGKIHPSEWELVQENWEGVVTPREGQDQASYVVPTEDV